MKIKARKFVFYTSCAANYLAKAVVLSQSLRSTRYEYEFHLLYCDENEKALQAAKKIGKFDKIYTLADLEIDEKEAFKYNVMEMCTKVKPKGALKILQNIGVEAAIYVDPDAMFFSDLDHLIDEFKDSSIGLTPHFVDPINGIGEIYRLTELSVLRHGLFNLGFIFIRNDASGVELAKWWSDRLEFNCYDEPLLGRFTDQRVFDLVPINFPKTKISRHKGINAASWNAHEKNITFSQVGNTLEFKADKFPLVFYHFSGVNSKGVSDYVLSKAAPNSIAVRMLEGIYRGNLNKCGQEIFEKFDYWGNKFRRNGNNISQRARRLYRDNIDLQLTFTKPYSAGGYEDWLKSNAVGVLGGSPFLSDDKIVNEIYRIFDYQWYAAKYIPDINFDGNNKNIVIDHYVVNCHRPKINPSRFFDTNYLLYESDFPIEAPPLHASKYARTPLFQFLKLGSQGKYSPNRFFDEMWYLNKYPDVAKAVSLGIVSSGFYHYCIAGSLEGRNPGPYFSEDRYKKLNPDVADAVSKKNISSGFDHFMQAGLLEGRPF